VKATVVVPTYNRAQQLARVLESLVRQRDAPSFEVIVCDDGSTDDTASVAAAFGRRLELRYCFQEDAGFRAGKARNNGIRRARGDVVIFVDDDCLCPSAFVSAHVRAHAAGAAVALGCRARAEDAEAAEVDAALAAAEADEREAIFAEGLGAYDAPWMLVYSCNLSVRRSHPDAYFDERFTGWGMEDTDLGYRLWRSEATFSVVREATVLHLEDDAPRDPFRCERRGLEPDYSSYLVNCVRLLAKYPEDDALGAAILEDLSWYAASACGRWAKDGYRHDPMLLVRALAADVSGP